MVKTHPLSDHSLTSPSPPPVAKFNPSALAPIVADGCQAAPPTLSVCPLFVDTALRFGRSHNLASPVHDVVKTYCELGEKRNVDSGRSSPNCDPRFVNVYDGQVSPARATPFSSTHLELLIQLLPSADDFAQWQADLYTLSRYSFPRSGPRSVHCLLSQNGRSSDIPRQRVPRNLPSCLQQVVCALGVKLALVRIIARVALLCQVRMCARILTSCYLYLLLDVFQAVSSVPWLSSHRHQPRPL